MEKVLITGVNSGIGHALSEAYINRGAKIYGIGKKRVSSHSGENFNYLQLDLKAPEKIPQKLSAFLNGEQKLDMVLLNAGILGEIKEMSDTALYEIEEVMAVNVWANKVIIDTLNSMNIEVGQIVGISSGAAVNASKGWGSYSLSKSALNMLLKLYSREMENTHITALAPGVIDTPMVRYITDEVDPVKYPSAKRLKEGPILKPEVAAQRLIEAFEKIKSYESGSFLDIRTMQ